MQNESIPTPSLLGDVAGKLAGRRRPLLKRQPAELTAREVDALESGAKLIPLTQGKWAIVDADDYSDVLQYRWQVTNMQGRFYATRAFVLTNGKRTTFSMQRHLFGLLPNSKDPMKIRIDHKDHDTLDNRRNNLRFCSNAENCRNQLKRKNTSSKYKGVSRFRQEGSWRAQITRNYQNYSLGVFATEIAAAKAYDMAAKRLHGRFANLNFPD